jgi:endonuclease/exonuclease/phosphatase (EEP) superfamily protein YafD
MLGDAVGLVAIAIACSGLISRFLPITNHVMLGAAALSPYLMLAAPLAIALFASTRRWLLVAVAVSVAVAAIAVELPLFVGSNDTQTQGVRLRVLSVNLKEGEADAASLVASGRDQADVLSFQELTPAAVDRLSVAGIDATFPYRWLDAKPDARGIGIWSRFPLEDTRRFDGYGFAQLSTRVRVTRTATSTTLLAVHLVGPWPQAIDRWRQDIGQLPTTLKEVSERAEGGCVVVAGDFNATFDMRPFRDLLRDGFRDAAEQSGAGILRTFPADTALPALIEIDHVLTHGCVAASLQTVWVPGSDHRGLIADVVMSRALLH